MLRKLTILTLAAISFAALLALTAACGGGDDDEHMDGGMMSTGTAPEGSIRVGLVNWAVEPAATSAKAGEVTFWAVHDMAHGHSNDEGGVTHDLQVMRKKADGSMEMAGQVTGLKMGDAKALTLNLAAGDYELSCNVVEELKGKVIPHYAKGMKTPFKVTG